MAGIKDRDTRLGLDDVLKFAKMTAANADDGVIELNKLLELQKEKQEAISKEDVADYELTPEEKIQLVRDKNKIRDELKQLEKNIEIVRERTLTLERSCDIDQEVASWILDKEVNYRQQPRLQPKGDIAFEVKELKERLVLSESRKARWRDFRKNLSPARIALFLLGLLLILLIILLLLRTCNRMDESRMPVVAVNRPAALEAPILEFDTDKLKGTIESQWTEEVAGEDVIFVPYKEPEIPMDPIVIDYYIVDGDLEDGFMIADGSLFNTVDRDKPNYVISEFLDDYMGRESSSLVADLPSIQNMLNEDIAKKAEDAKKAEEQKIADAKKAAQDAVHALAPDDEFYDIDITNPGKKSKEQKAEEALVAALGDTDEFYDIDVENAANTDDFSYDIDIANPSDSARYVAAASADQSGAEGAAGDVEGMEGAEGAAGLVASAQGAEANVLSPDDEYYDIDLGEAALGNLGKLAEEAGSLVSSLPGVSDAQGVSSALGAGLEGAQEAFVDIADINGSRDAIDRAMDSGWMEYYDIELENDYRPAAEEEVETGSIEQMIEKGEDDFLAAQNDNGIMSLYLDYTAEGGGEGVSYVNEVVRTGPPIDFDLLISPYTLNVMMYPYHYYSNPDEPSMIESRGIDLGLGKYAASISLGMRYRIINDGSFNFFLGLRGGYMYSFNPVMTNIEGFLEVGVGFLGFDAYLGVGTIVSGLYNNTIGIGAELGVSYNLHVSQMSSIVIGLNAMVGVGIDNSGIVRVSPVIDVNVNPYIGYKLSLDSAQSVYREVEPSKKTNNNYKIVRDGEDNVIKETDIPDVTAAEMIDAANQGEEIK